MPELRRDKLIGRSVLIAENRANRPNEFAVVHDELAARAASQSNQPSGAARPAAMPACPFCPGQEHLTPAAVYEALDADRRWQIRVVPNKFPAVDQLSADDATHAIGDSAAQFDTATALGVHEVIIESARHADRLSALTVSELRGVLDAYAARLRYWRDDGRLAYGLVFKNQGPRAGASLGHLHSQLIALPEVPGAVAAELSRAELKYRQHPTCPYCRNLQHERTRGERIVFDDGEFVVLCPFASLQPGEVWLVPAGHEPSFEGPRTNIDRLAGVLHTLVDRIESILPEPAYNLLLRTAPWGVSSGDWFHWRIELLPRMTSFAGFELATGVFINPVAPERAASKLRSLWLFSG